MPKMGQFFSSAKTPVTVFPGKAEAVSSSETLPVSQLTSTVEAAMVLTKAKGHYWYPTAGEKILDACGGAGVACIGHGRDDVVKAAAAQMSRCAYVSYAHFKTTPTTALSDWLIQSTQGRMQKVYLMCSGMHSSSNLTLRAES